MKSTDFAPRTGALEAHLSGSDLIGVEVGCDVGAHAESLLTYCDVKKLHIIDPWLNIFCEGYCMGRLSRFVHRVYPHKGLSADVVKKFTDGSLDFVYLDQEHDYVSVREDLNKWWPKLKAGGIIALRNYSASNEGLKRAADEFARGKESIIDKYCNEILIWKQNPST